ncbi:unnamed protein product [Rotaria sp. Silwood1]|nr:unnamed protein product [Rotaria sp. Silwood1]CAF4756122.1 unnamed protein product [Rotaria sp. Silwood1]
MVYRDRQGVSPTNDPIQISNNRDRYLDNCFLLCINRNDDADIPEIHRLDNNNLIRELCNKNPLNQIKSQQQSKLYIQNQREPRIENHDYDDNDNNDNDDDDNIVRLSKQQKHPDYIYRQKKNQYDRDSRFITNSSKYQPNNTIDNYYAYDQYSPTAKYNYHRNDYNIMQHSDDELSVYVPTNTLNRLGDKRINNNMVLINYEDASVLRDIRQPTSPYEQPQQNISSQYNNYVPLNQYNEYSPQYPYDLSSDLTRIRNDQQQFYQNTSLQQQQQQQPRLDSPQSGPFLPTNIPIDHSNAINIRRHMYSPSQLPQGLTEGQLVMLLQKGSQYQQIKSGSTGQQTQLFPNQKETQLSTTTAVTVAPQATVLPSISIEALKSPSYVPSSQIKMPQVPPHIIDHALTNDDKISIVDEITKPMSTLNTRNSIKLSKDIVESREESKEKKKDKLNDEKKDKKAEKDGSHKKDHKKEKSSGKDAKKKKK